MGKIRSDIAWSTADRIVVRGKSFPEEILGKMNLGDFAWLQLTGNVPTPQQSNVFNAIIVALVEHGFPKGGMSILAWAFRRRLLIMSHKAARSFSIRKTASLA